MMNILFPPQIHVKTRIISDYRSYTDFITNTTYVCIGYRKRQQGETADHGFILAAHDTYSGESSTLLFRTHKRILKFLPEAG